MADTDRAYASDVLMLLAMLAVFGPWGAAASVVITLCRHSPIVANAVGEWRITDTPNLIASAGRWIQTGETGHRPGVRALPAEQQRPASVSAPVPAPAPTPRTHVAERKGPRLFSPQEFADDPMFVALNEEPHRLVIGHTQGGKSTAMHGMAMAWAAQGHPVTVLDPDAARGQWPGCDVAGYAEDYRGISRALDRVRNEFDERSQLYAAGQRDFAPFHIIADEVHETIRNVPGARDFLFETVARRGAKRGIFLTLGTQGNNADELDLESAGVLNNFKTVELEVDERGRRVATIYRGNAAKKKHVTQYLVPPLPGAKTFVQQVKPITAPALIEAPPLDLSDFLTDLLAMDVPAAPVAPVQQQVRVMRDAGSVVVNVSQQTAAPATRSRRRANGVDIAGRRARADKLRQIRLLVAEGKSANDIDRMLPGERQEILAMVRQVKRETSQ